jgi:integrase
MQGHLRRRGKQSWALCIQQPLDPVTGKRPVKWHSIKAKSKAEAEEEQARILREISDGLTTDAGRLKVLDLGSQWLKHHSARIAPRSLERYQTIMKKYIDPNLGDIFLRKLTPGHVQRFYDKLLGDGRSAGVIRYAHVTLHCMLKYALRLQLVGRNVCDAVESPRPNKPEVRAFDDTEIAKLVKSCAGTSLHVPVMLALCCGLRRSEALALRWANVDVTSGVLRVRESLEVSRRTGEAGRLPGGRLRFKEPKTRASRRVVAIPNTMLALLAQRRLWYAQQRLNLGPAFNDHDLVCSHDDGRPLDPQYISKVFSKLAEGCKIPNAHFHCLRHTFATTLLRLGVHPKVAADALGHSTVAMTLDRYSHSLQSLQDDAATKLDAALRATFDGSDSPAKVAEPA